MVPKESGFNQSVAASGMCAGKAWRFPGSIATMRNGKLVQISHSCYHVETIRHPISSYVTTKLYGTYTFGCNNNTIFSKRAILTFLTVDVGYAAHVSLAAGRPWSCTPKWQYGDIVDFITFRVWNLVSASVPCQLLWLYYKVVLLGYKCISRFLATFLLFFSHILS